MDKTHVYWTDPATDGVGAVFRVPLGGGVPVAIEDGDGPASVVLTAWSGPNHIAVDATSVYFTTVDSIMKMAK